MVYSRIESEAFSKPLINKMEKSALMPKVFSGLSLAYFLSFPCDIIDKEDRIGTEQQWHANINVTVRIQINNTLFSPLPSKIILLSINLLNV